jgi:hypothetical protein
MLGLFMTSSFLVAQLQPYEGPELPNEVADLVRAELDEEFRLCADHGNSPSSIDKGLRTAALTIRQGIEAFLITGMGPCFSAPVGNGDVFVYARIENQWRKVLDANGQRVEVRNARTNGWRDLEVWRHGSALESERFIWQFDGRRYNRAFCDSVRFGDWATGQALKRPEFSRCQGRLPSLGK